MSVALWCKYGGHAFDSDDENAVQDTVKMKVRNDVTGRIEERTYVRDICGPHVSEALNFSRPEITAKGEDNEL